MSASPPAAPRFYTTAELATLFRTSVSTVEYWRRQRRLTGPLGVVIGRRVLYPAAAVDALVQRMITDQSTED